MAEAWLQRLTQLAAQLAPGRRVLSGLGGGAAGFALAELVRDRQAKLPLLVVVPSREEAEVLEREIRFYLGDSPIPVLSLPADDVAPYEGLSPHPGIPRARIAALHALDQQDRVVVITPARALHQRVLPREVLAANRTEILLRGRLDRDALLRRLVDWGYLVSGAADEPGTVATRGGLIDIWPAGDKNPVRIELFDDEVDDIRPLDPVTMRSASRGLHRLTVLPAREAILSPEALTRASDLLSRAVDEHGAGHATRKRALIEMREGLWFPGAEDYLAALHPVVSLLSYADNVAVIDFMAVTEALDEQALRVARRWEEAEPEERAPVPPALRFVPAQQLRRSLSEALILDPMAPDAPHFGARDNKILRVGATDLAGVAARIRGWLDEGWQVAFCADGGARAERLLALLSPHGLRPRAQDPGVLPPPGVAGLWSGPLERGFHAPESQLAIIAADELFGQREHRAPPPRSVRQLSSLSQLKVGDAVVHARHGVGRFEGLKRLPLQLSADPVWGIERAGGEKLEQDFAVVSYLGGDRLYLPVTRLDQLARYQIVGDATPKLDKLGGETWTRKKSKVKDKVLALAHDLLRAHALRASAPGHAYLGLPDDYQQFEAAFEYIETPDQEATIRDVLADLARPEPMDRLVIGDVGFGKTEVAMRAAMRVILDGYQVAVLCPTTVLALQHADSFKERFADVAVRIELLSRFRDAGEAKAVMSDAAAGKVDILIGTHSLLSRDLRFRKLGLIVVDEEHRFGVKQKEKLKKIVTSVDYLAMSATPIPRSLHMALSGLRAVSTITTPPAARQAIRTRVARWSDHQIRDEILHELKRGGQAFFVHNRVQSLASVATRIRELVPEARVGIAHGQMAADALEKVLYDFTRRDLSVLVCTAIIESGVDMPNVNTMIIDRADQLGLAQLHQLRGRVGRGHVRGNCILLLPNEGRAAPDAMRRLQTLVEHTELGAGFAIATADLELRGSGNLLGPEQHGHIEAVGLDTYLELLEAAVLEARGELAAQKVDPELEINVPALLPEDYIDDIDTRLTEYRRLATCRTVQQVQELLDEWEDSYGRPTPEVLNLGWLAETRVRAAALGLSRVSWLKVKVLLDFHESTTVNPATIARLITEEPARWALPRANTRPEGASAWRLEVRVSPSEAEFPFRFLHMIFGRLAGT